MRATVTGAAGHVGANLVRALLARGDEVVALVRSDRRALEGLPLRMVEGDLSDPASLRRAFAGADVVFHAAAHISITGSDGGLTEAINVEGAANAAQAALDVGVGRYVHISSVHAFRHAAQSPVSESSERPGEGAAAYDRSKAAGEVRVRDIIARGLSAVIVNPSGVIGPSDFKPSRMGEVLLSLAHRRLPALVAGGFDWVDARDVCDGALAAAERGRVGENYILSGHWRSVRELADTFARVSGVPAPRLVTPIWLARAGLPPTAIWSRLTGARPLFTSESLDTLATGAPCSHAKAAAELGYTPRPLEDTLRDTLAWFAAQGLAPAPVPT